MAKYIDPYEQKDEALKTLGGTPVVVDPIANAVGYTPTAPSTEPTPTTTGSESNGENEMPPYSIAAPTSENTQAPVHFGQWNNPEQGNNNAGDYEFDLDDNGKVVVTPTVTTPSSDNEFSKLMYQAQQGLVNDESFLSDLANLFRKPEDPEEQAKRERAAAVSQGVGRLGNAFNALGNLFFVNKGALNQTIPDLANYGDTIDKYRESLDKSRKNYADFQMKLHQLRLDGLNRAITLAKTDAERRDAVARRDAYVRTQEALARKYGVEAGIKKIELDEKSSPEYQETQKKMQESKQEEQDAKVEATHALARQRETSATKNVVQANNIREGKSGNSGKGSGNKYSVAGKMVDANELRSIAGKHKISLTRSVTTKGIDGTEKTEVKTKTPEELVDELNKKLSSGSKPRTQQPKQGNDKAKGSSTQTKGGKKRPLN